MFRAWMVGLALAHAVLPASPARLPKQSQLRLQSQLPSQSGPKKRWPPRASIRVWLDPRSTPPGAGLLVERALATWTRAAAGRFVLEASSAQDAAIRVRFAQAAGIYGEAAPRIDRATGYIGSADVLIAGEVPGDSLHQRIVVYLTALHEVGHALGLPHTNAFDDIMYAFRRPDDGRRYFGAYRRQLRTSDDIGTERAAGLSAADLDALRTLYE